MRETKSRHINSPLISMLAFGTTEGNDPVRTSVRPRENHQTDSCRKGCPGGRQDGQVQFPDEETRLIQDHLVSGVGQCSIVTATKLRVASRGLCLSTFCLPWGGVVISQAPIHPLLPSTVTLRAFLQIFARHLLCVRPMMGLPSWGWVFKGERQDSPPAKQMTLRLQGFVCTIPFQDPVTNFVFVTLYSFS